MDYDPTYAHTIGDTFKVKALQYTDNNVSHRLPPNVR